jgi:hypothetical protein
MFMKRISPIKGRKFPERWVSGPDELEHRQYYVFVQQRNQAQWRGEQWLLEFPQWQQLWSEHWHQRGRCRDDYCMTRQDPDLAWDIDNTIVVTRLDHCKIHRQRQVQGGYKFISNKERKRLGKQYD